ncbi:MAG TPA: class I adenylate-forming enzyme family protein [Burkholderiaceae bacterium]|nr:class I adenylate-forming enzyme family protein [Burkholderiaceae bacterium]
MDTLPWTAPGECTAARVLQWAQWQPHAPAISDDGRALSYGALADAIHATSAMLAAEGLGPGDRIMVIGENSVALAVMLLGASHRGVCAVVENVRRVPAEIAGILAHSQPHRVYVIGASAEARRHAEALGAQARHSAALGDYSIAIPPDAAAAESAAESAVEWAKKGDAMPRDIAIIIYTTGTTGQPKGVMLTHANLIYIATMMRALRHLSPRDRVYGILPATHVMGHASVFLGTLHNGAALHMVARFDPARCVATLAEQRITCIQGAPAMFASIAAYCETHPAAGMEPGRRFPDVRFIGSGGAPIDTTIKAAAERLFGCELQNGYGLTEAASTCWTRFNEGNADDNVGPPLPGVEVCLRDSAGRTVADGEVGELWMRGPNLMAGYFRNPEQTRRVVDADGWFNTQDLARLLPGGRLLIVGRTKDVIVRSGFNVYPLEVEAALNTHPAVLHSAVVGRSVPGNEEVVAYVELIAAGSTDAHALAAHLASLLSPYKRPVEIVIVAALPLAANGKVLKSQLAQACARHDHATPQPGDRI